MSKSILGKLELVDGKLPRVAAVHDICGYGNCSLAVALPVVSSAGVDVLPIPTSVLSAHTGFPSYTFLDTTDQLNDYIDNWQELEVEVNGIYTGFLGSEEQIDIIKRLHSLYPEAVTIIDPVMGDNGEPYSTYTPELCSKMRELVPIADLLTPNLTEASILLDEDYPGINISATAGREIAQKLINMGARNVVLKGIEDGDEVLNIVLSEHGDYAEVRNKLHVERIHGTGDLFASLITAGLFSGHSLVESTQFAADFVYDAIEYSSTLPGFRLRGVNYEPMMYRITDFCLNR